MSNGKLTNCVVMRDPSTKHYRGFGLVTHTTEKIGTWESSKTKESCVKKRLSKTRSLTVKNIIVGIEEDTEEHHFRHYFEQYGKTEVTDIMTDRDRNKEGLSLMTMTSWIILPSRNTYYKWLYCEVRKGLSKQDMVSALSSQRG